MMKFGSLRFVQLLDLNRTDDSRGKSQWWKMRLRQDGYTGRATRRVLSQEARKEVTAVDLEEKDCRSLIYSEMEGMNARVSRRQRSNAGV
jgi:hypothetical protein